MSHLDATFGVELECFLPEGGTQRAAAAAVAARIGKPVNVQGYNHSTSPSWKVVGDGSLGDYVRGCEFVSPILRGTEGLEELAKVCAALTDFGCTVNRKCGLHVHVGVAGMQVPQFSQLIKLYAAFEPVLDAMMPASRRGSTNTFCQTMTAIRPQAIDGAVSMAKLLELVGSRYRKLNLQSYRRYTTVEFRQHSGTLDASKATMWVRLCLRMVYAARTGRAAVRTTGRSANQARPGTRAHQIGELFLRPGGVTSAEVLALTGWRAVNMPRQALAAGLTVTTQRTGNVTRYSAVAAVEAEPATAITVAGFAAAVALDTAEQTYVAQRSLDLCGPVAWAA
jgi:hypothetical protein